VDHNGALNVNITSNTKDLSLIETANDIEHTNDSLINLENIKKYKVLINLENNSFFNAKTAVLIHILQELSYLRCLIFVEKKTLLEQINERLI
jgi:superfamily II DNA/RNA helicase